jgi:nicotinamide-nucleotide amidase
VEKDGKYLIAMPGPPGEMKRMWLNEVLPRLHESLNSSDVIFSRTLKLWGLSESHVSELMAPFFASSNPTLGIYVKRDGIHLRLTAKAENAATAREIITPSERKIKTIFQNELWGYDEDTMSGNVASMLFRQSLIIATLESFTGGLLGYTLAEPCQEKFRGSLVCSPQSSPEDIFPDASHYQSTSDARYPEKAELLAQAVRKTFQADVALSLTSLSDDAAQADDVYLGIVHGSKGHVVSLKYPRDRVNVKQMATSAALFHLMKTLSVTDFSTDGQGHA